MTRAVIDSALDDEIEAVTDSSDLFQKALEDFELRSGEDDNGVVEEELAVGRAEFVSKVFEHGSENRVE